MSKSFSLFTFTCFVLLSSGFGSFGGVCVEWVVEGVT